MRCSYTFEPNDETTWQCELEAGHEGVHLGNAGSPMGSWSAPNPARSLPASAESVEGSGSESGDTYARIESEAVLVQRRVMEAALAIYADRNPKYNDNWSRFGWRGCLFRVRERAERLWDQYWDKEPSRLDFDLDDAYDLLNFVCFFIRAVEANNRDGEWWT